jgi:ComEC/Rec2-related protein
MSLLEHLEAEPERFVPGFSLALGVAAGFYPLFLPRPLVALAACAAAGPGLVLAELARAGGGRGPRLRSIRCLALALGLALGLALRTDEAGRSAPLAEPAAGPRLERLEAVGLKGRLSADSSPVSKGYRYYPLVLEALKVSAPGISGEYSRRDCLPLLAQGGEALEAGAPVETAGVLVAGKEGSARGPAFFARGRLIAADGRILPEVGADTSRAATSRATTSRRPRDLREFRAELRRGFRSAIASAGGREAKGLLEALLMGFRDDLDAEEAEDFKKAGCAHILALSGQHLSILAAAASLLCKPVFGPRKSRIASIFLAAVFVFVAGPGPSLLRSILMYGLAALAFFLDRPQPSLAVLALVFVATALVDPAAARSLSYALSYLALFGLIVLGPCFERLLLPILPPPLAAALAASLAAQCATAPLMAIAFGALYPAGILASVVSGPLVAAFIWWGLGASLLVGLVSGLGPSLALVSGLIHRALAWTMAFFAGWPSIALSGAALPLAAAVVVLIAAFVYALPYVEYRAFAHRRAQGWAPNRAAEL